MRSLFERVTGRNIPPPDAPDVVERCLFCNVSPERDFRIVAENDRFVVFRDKYPAARAHLLVTPRVHIPNTSNLGQGDVELVKAMHALGMEALDSLQQAEGTAASKGKGPGRPPKYIFGFHVPPFRSVDHLHLHCLQMPYLSKRQGLKYPISEPPSSHSSGSSGKTPYFKGTGWFVTAEQAVDILAAGRKIGFGPC
ncbi:hypothetical protein OC835_003809 [Tilletia horrida]|nr:hypothetical protein OC835_003809 [Tilletia horrida]